MSLDVDVINSLKSLPCFNEIQAISLLVKGLSQTSLKVTTASQVFFAKKLHHDTAITEVYCALTCSTEDSTQDLSPQVIYHDQQWLVTEFIDGMTLTDSAIEDKIKISTSIALMAKLHKLPISSGKQSIPELNTAQSANRLLTKPVRYLAHQSPILDKVTKCLTLSINSLIQASENPNALCHGDINFTNILVDKGKRSWLIDFECAHIAPVDFDLAMFIAVNNIPTQQLNELVHNYNKLNPQYRCNKALLNHYILYSFFINGLWYFNNKHNDRQSEVLFHKLALEQWSAFDRFSIECAIEIPKLIPLLA